MCIDDLDYQHFRQQVRAADWQKAFLNKPLGEREAIAQGLRHQSERSKQEKSMAIMDVNTQAVHEFVANQGIETLIHGHTHRPGRHNASFTRWVLPDWDLARKRWLASLGPNRSDKSRTLRGLGLSSFIIKAQT